MIDAFNSSKVTVKGFTLFKKKSITPLNGM